MPHFRRLSELDVGGRTVLVRSDLNVPMQEGVVSDATRIERSAPTWQTLIDHGARVVILTHFGRPKGKPEAGLSVAPLTGAISAALGGRPVSFAADCIGATARSAIASAPRDGVVLLENLRFHAGEEANDPAFAAELAQLGEAYVGDAFSCAHRAHASVEAITRLLPSAAGLLMEAELDNLGRALEQPKRPVVAIVGGAKVSTKLDLLGNLVEKVDVLVIGGGMANTFLHAQGVAVGRSLCEVDLADTARAIAAKAEASGCRIVLPVDARVAEAFAAGVPDRIVPIDAIPDDHMILDIGPESVRGVEALLSNARTVVWNGPMGAFEIPPFDTGTVAAARAAAELTRAGSLLSVAGGGDTVAALVHAGVDADFSYVSTAGGAFLEWMEGKTLPGVAALEAAAA